jgi:hypothetical protein
MTRDEIIEMAREWLPKAYRDGDVGDEPKFTRHNMEVAFAAGAAAEREACAKVCDDYEDWCDTWGQDDKHMAAVSAASELAQAIRARGEK